MRVILVLLATASANAVSGQVTDPDVGREIYLSYCVQCHGFDAEGAGPMAEILAVETPDLTLLAKRNEGFFPTSEVAMKIDGRAQVLAHGGDMPLFGPLFDAGPTVTIRLSSGQPMMMSRTLADLVSYLETLQAQ
ncbi:c-type cytochrome [Tropicimonas marinistellae]|uniref:c-type cytochrome n=1 Tax=Tropicimonas marinistellae TaxID=1739787 RepID=UPI00082AE927|nr:c-type cytochrome [Tropicimonas marinistellae]